MKRKFILLLTILALTFIAFPINADGVFDITKWKFKMLTHASDQDENVYVSKYYYADDHDKYAFCLQPEERYILACDDYEFNKYADDYVYSIVKAYSKLVDIDENDEYYIATQLLIWQHTTGSSYTFANNDYSKQKEEILKLIDSKPLLLTDTKKLDAYVDEEYTLNVDYSMYDVECEGIDIKQNNNDGFKFIVKDELPEYKTIAFTPKVVDEDNMYIFKSEKSQDLYYFDGEYSDLKPFAITIKTLIPAKTIDIKYSKFDENNKPIIGAEFTLYAKDDESNSEIYFIQTDKTIDLQDILIDNYNILINPRIELSERYNQYFDGRYINTNEIGYFPYKIYSNNDIIKQGIVYVTNDSGICEGDYSKINVRDIYKGYSEDSMVNTISNIPKKNTYYLCESEPKKGYTYASNPCVLIDGNTYDNSTYTFINNYRTYTLRLMKQSPEEILLDGAKFKLTFEDDGETNEIRFTTGSLYIEQEENNKYLIYKYEHNDEIQIHEFTDGKYEETNAQPGKYYYYQSNSRSIDISRLEENYTMVVDGGYLINNLPYSSSLTIEELEAPKGYIIDEPIYHITPDISYSEITFKNYRVNNLDIVPGKRFRIPKTCIE